MAEGDFYAVAMLRNSIASATQAPPDAKAGGEGLKFYFIKKKEIFFFKFFFYPAKAPA